ncbi:MAG: hypothetical protein K2Y22_14015 [Candidatus Obscuribacterales bacterium]|nr:hypothetical protein [Candidatus Obscuribacterales bacterium]
MTNEISNTAVNVSINDNQTPEERAVAEAVLKAAHEAEKKVRKEQLAHWAEQFVAQVEKSVFDPCDAPNLQVNLLRARETRAQLAAEGGSELTTKFDQKVLSLIYEMIKTNNHTLIYPVIDIVRSALPARFNGNQNELTVYIKLALVEYALAHAVHDDAAREAAGENKNAGNQNYAVERKIEDAVYGQASPEEAIDAAQLEANRQVWCAILGKSEHALYLKTACENLAMALLASDSPANPQLLKLRTLLDKIRRGG